jgi:hypothetical protein
MVDGKGGHKPLTQGRYISVILAEEKVGRREWRWQRWQPNSLAEEKVGKREWWWQPSGGW